MENWSKLKADEKIRVIKFARLNGVSDIKTIRDTYNLYSNGDNLAHKYDGEQVGESLKLNWYKFSDNYTPGKYTDLIHRLPESLQKPVSKARDYTGRVLKAVGQVVPYTGWVHDLMDSGIIVNTGNSYLGIGKLADVPFFKVAGKVLSLPDLVDDSVELYNAVLNRPSEKKIAPYIEDKIIGTIESNLKSTGGPLYPFSFEKNPFLKTPVVRYDGGGQTYTVKKGDTFSLIAQNVGVSVENLLNLNPTITNVNRIREGLNINIPTYMFSEIFNTTQPKGLLVPQVLTTQPLQQQNTPILSVEAPKQKGLKTAGPLDLQELAVRQAYTESRLRPDIVNSKGAYGLFQIMLPALDDYNRINKTNYTLEDMKNADNNIKVRNWYMDYLSNLGFINKGDIQSDSVGMYKVLASFNAGAGNVRNALTKAKADGKDIYDSWDWVSYLWDEPREYADFILRGIETKGTNKNDSVYKAVSTAKSGTANKIRSSIKL